ncbi:hypothetical protein CNEO4_2450008 [Clostridium neonatale]|uniref:Uncharacterized protein n=1 Tax=Clostridium neonatale TaxID=137838 RepID=A0AA86JFT8_9CLOT|nr:hypothetical protein CNEO_10080 [Clostridium neonatale]CAI3211707.1 hypothetical protein CNEO2_700033 [Clostridium neonatale]CAI3214204.1 hypothetical protein CNEO2_710007 [Clostridium neonatale]CAI3243256.1 hypothetical protein CNEO2_40008 [Clostridium neonatale]CAI3535336.1 hypothetical protein CNEO3_1040023 [Clostridium neonatale]
MLFKKVLTCQKKYPKEKSELYLNKTRTIRKVRIASITMFINQN